MSFRAASLRVPSFAASLVVTSLLACGCGCGGGSSSTSGVGGTTGSGAAVPVTLPDGTTVPTVACGDESVSTASGSWDVVASGTSAAGSANLTIDASSFVVQSSARTLAFRSNGTTMTLQWIDTGANRQSAIAVTHTGAAVETGVMPVAVGGDWTFRGQGSESCSAALTATAFNATCSQVRTPQFGRLEGTVVGSASRSSLRSSASWAASGTSRAREAGPSMPPSPATSSPRW